LAAPWILDLGLLLNFRLALDCAHSLTFIRPPQNLDNLDFYLEMTGCFGRNAGADCLYGFIRHS